MNKTILKLKLFCIVIFAIGHIIPFTKAAIVEMFLLLPIGLIFIVVIALFFALKNAREQMKLIILFIPLFFIAQIISVISVNAIQKIRSSIIIDEVNAKKNELGYYPTDYETAFGIEYVLLKDKENFVVKYSRGFLVTERYYSEDSKWRSRGWND